MVRANMRRRPALSNNKLVTNPAKQIILTKHSPTNQAPQQAETRYLLFYKGKRNNKLLLVHPAGVELWNLVLGNVSIKVSATMDHPSEAKGLVLLIEAAKKSIIKSAIRQREASKQLTEHSMSLPMQRNNRINHWSNQSSNQSNHHGGLPLPLAASFMCVARYGVQYQSLLNWFALSIPKHFVSMFGTHGSRTFLSCFPCPVHSNYFTSNPLMMVEMEA